MAVEINHLYKRYGDLVLYEDFSCRFSEGQTTALLGPSGGGKTTLLRMLAGLEKPDQGQIRLPEQARISFLFQEDRLLPWLSVKDNVKWVLKSQLGKAEAEERAQEALSLLGLFDWRDQPIDQLSGGMQRRVACARAIAYDGNLILLDEPFKGLDGERKEQLMDDLKQRWAGQKKTILLVTHDEREAMRMADCTCRFSGRPVQVSFTAI